MSVLLQIDNLHAQVEDKKILNGLNLTVNKGEVHVIMGPNGAGKSTLANVIFNNPEYEKLDGRITFEDEDISEESTNKIAQKGLFMSFQTPVEIPGISTMNFLKYAKGKQGEKPLKSSEFRKTVESVANEISMDKSLMARNLNVGYSGGEKKKNEILQMLILNPKLAILDETDSGLDVDAVKIVSKGINLFKNDENAIIIITHNNKMFHSIKADFVHVLVDGKIVETGGFELAEIIENEGFKKYKA